MAVRAEQAGWSVTGALAGTLAVVCAAGLALHLTDATEIDAASLALGAAAAALLCVLLVHRQVRRSHLQHEKISEEFDALARGVRYRAIYERAMLLEPGALAVVERGVRAGEQARVLDRLPVRLAVVDGRTAVCPLVPDRDGGEPTAAVIGRSQLLDALLALFESHWLMATPLGTPADRAGTGYQPDGDEARLLSLFVAGVPDKSIASQLGVSRRTVQRRLADLMAAAGVDTRPGLAFQAARRGWI